LKIRTAEIQKVKNMLVDTLVANGVTKPRKSILKDINRDFWMSAQEAIDYGLADQIVSKGFLQ